MDTIKARQLIEQAQHHAEELNKILEKLPVDNPIIFVEDDGRVDFLLPDSTLVAQDEDERLKKIKWKGRNQNGKDQER